MPSRLHVFSSSMVVTCQLRVFSSNNIPKCVLITQEYTWPTKLRMGHPLAAELPEGLGLATTRRNTTRNFEPAGEVGAAVCRPLRPCVVVWGCLLLQYLAERREFDRTLTPGLLPAATVFSQTQLRERMSPPTEISQEFSLQCKNKN